MVNMRCVLCKACLGHEAIVAAYAPEIEREQCRWEVKGTEWLWETGGYKDEGELVLCSTGCLTDWMVTGKVLAANTLGEYKPSRPQPAPPTVSMTMETHSAEDMERIYSEVLISGFPAKTPEQMIRNIAASHGSVVQVIMGKGAAYIQFALGASGESFFLSCNCVVLPPSLQTDTPLRLNVEFLHFLPEVNANLYDEMFGMKCTRQLLRAMPRTASKPLTPQTCEKTFGIWKSHLAQQRCTPDRTQLLRDATTDANILVARNWLLYRYNFDDSYLRAKKLIESHGGNLSQAMVDLEGSHINSLIGDPIMESFHKKQSKAAAANNTKLPCPTKKHPASLFVRSEKAVFDTWWYVLSTLPLLYNKHAFCIASLLVVIACLSVV